MNDDQMTRQLAVHMESAFIIGCSRCANEGTFFTGSRIEAGVEARRAGWTVELHDYLRNFCPSCNGGTK